MLTRLRVRGFKNLLDSDIRFGPFTCIAGPNATGKSNLFDAIRFLSSLADRRIMEAAMNVRDESGKNADIKSLFYRTVGLSMAEMSFEAEMIVPAKAVDDLGQTAKATTTFLRYTVSLSYNEGTNSLDLEKEELVHIPQREAPRRLVFPHKAATWRKTALTGARRAPYFISTEKEGDQRIIKVHQDGSSGRPLRRLASTLPRTVVSAANAAESPTALAVRKEMQSWRLLQLEPSAMRMPDEFTAPSRLGSDGSHLAATLHRLSKSREEAGAAWQGDTPTCNIYSEVANRLSELIDDVSEVRVERDEKRELLTLFVKDATGTSHAARSLSDGTLRFLALAVLAHDPSEYGLICLEEPENGIHPERIPAMLELLQDTVTDVEEEIGSDNPLRQVIINTHSPGVVAQVPDETLLVAELVPTIVEGKQTLTATFSPLPGTWRTLASDGANQRTVNKGKLLAYLNPAKDAGREHTQGLRRVIDRPDLQQYVLPLRAQAS